MAYSQDDKELVRERTDLAELAAEVTKVKRSGRSVMAVCPFHDEKTPSLSIDPVRGLFHCFGCGKSGDVFDWVEETEGVDFVGALELLARRAGVELRTTPREQRTRGRREALLAAVGDAVSFYQERLRGAPDAATARSYLRGRGYDADVVDRFSLGYSPAGWDELTGHLRDRGHQDRAVEQAGLASRSRRGSLVDRFRGRVMFPIYDLRGDAVGFGARVLEGDGPKYLNSPESAIYHKSRLLYGLNWAKAYIVRRGEAVVVEGYTDVIAFHLAGRPVAVATCGTALGEEHLDLLRRFTERVVLAFDADAAGTGAALRGFERSVPGDLDLRVAVFPEGRDPADLVLAGETEALAHAIERSVPLLQFRIERDLDRYDLAEPEARGRAAAATARLIALHPDAVVRHEYAVMVSRRTGVDLPVVETAVSGARPTDRRPAGDRAQDGRLSGQQRAERELLRLLLANDPALRRHRLDAEMFTDELHRRGFELVGPAILALPPGAPPNLGRLLESKGDLAALLGELALEDRMLEPPDEVLRKLRLGSVERRIDALRRDIEAGEAADQDRTNMLRELIPLQRERDALKSAGVVD